MNINSLSHAGAAFDLFSDLVDNNTKSIKQIFMILKAERQKKEATSARKKVLKSKSETPRRIWHSSIGMHDPIHILLQ